MNFAEFFQKLHAEIKGEEGTDKFVTDFFSNAITDSTKNPLVYTSYDTVMSYYSGKRDFPKEIALSIEKNYDREKLYNFILNRYKTKAFSNENTYESKSEEWVKEFETLMYKISIFDKSYVRPFFVNLEKYDVREFIEKVDPTNFIKDKYITSCEEYVDVTRKKYSKSITTSASEEFTKKVLEFAKVLNDYIDYLSHNMVPIENVARTEDYLKIYSLIEQEDTTDDEDKANHNQPQIISSIEADDNGKFTDISQVRKYIPYQLLAPFHREDDIEWAIEFDNAVWGFRYRLCELYAEIYKLSNIELLNV